MGLRGGLHIHTYALSLSCSKGARSKFRTLISLAFHPLLLINPQRLKILNRSSKSGISASQSSLTSFNSSIFSSNPSLSYFFLSSLENPLAILHIVPINSPSTTPSFISSCRITWRSHSTILLHIFLNTSNAFLRVCQTVSGPASLIIFLLLASNIARTSPAASNCLLDFGRLCWVFSACQHSFEYASKFLGGAGGLAAVLAAYFESMWSAIFGSVRYWRIGKLEKLDIPGAQGSRLTSLRHGWLSRGGRRCLGRRLYGLPLF